MEDVLEALRKWPDALSVLIEDADDTYFSPMDEGKWSKAAVIAHILFWDRFFRGKRLPGMLRGEDLTGLDRDAVEELNEKAKEYAHSGIPLKKLIEESIKERNSIIQSLINQDLSFSFKIKGNTYTLRDYLWGEAEHDKHHLNQIY